MREILLDLLIRHEGIRFKPYHCPAGKLTIGIGRNLDDVGVTKEESIYLCNNDIDRCIKDAKAYHWFTRLNDARKIVVLDMLFTLGADGFFQFKKMLLALENSDYNLASKEMLNSKYARDVGKRALELAAIMKTGSL